MSLLAVNLFLSGLALMGNQGSPLSVREEAIWRKLQPSFVTTLRGGIAFGTAAMVDANGSFIAHKTSVPSQSFDARAFDGKLLRLQVKASDGTTQFVLLRVIGQLPDGLRPLDSPANIESDGRSLFAVTPDGPFRAFLSSDGKPGVVGPGKRVLPLGEVRFESPDRAFGGALLVSFQGEFMGVLGASLERRETLNNQVYTQGVASFGLPGGGVLRGRNADSADTHSLPFNRLNMNNMGPGGLTVAYTVSPSVIRRVIDGFKTPSHEVIFPVLGVFCKDDPNGGALILKVNARGPADQAGVRAGDTLLDIGGATIRNQIDFGLAMNRQKVGDKVLIRVRRNDRQVVLTVTIGKSED